MLLLKPKFFAITTLLFGLVAGKSTFAPARPPAIPLAVRSPYLNTLLYAGAGEQHGGGYLPGQVSFILA